MYKNYYSRQCTKFWILWIFFFSLTYYGSKKWINHARESVETIVEVERIVQEVKTTIAIQKDVVKVFTQQDFEENEKKYPYDISRCKKIILQVCDTLKSECMQNHGMTSTRFAKYIS